ncbi:hypothetical protein NM208_g12500 [Fusarium decemcellulare]|uniref:Uncharacterized protein n=1 Tax=Fusarium decemcellulare TaxID=57161 RepID=A0ACC1RP03_9HYPO|nr:hypothetical protein NM208_g12500 [Fusarium decemcellulare]
MAEAVGLAASIIAIVQLSAKVGSLCLKYSGGVKNATRDIAVLRNAVKDLGTTFQGAQKLLERPNSQELATSQELRQSLLECQTELEQLRERLAPGTTRKTMSKFGFRALKWPFDSKDVQEIITRLERYQRNITSALQIDQTTLLLHIKQGVENLSLQPDEDSKPNRKPCFMVPFEHDPDFVDRTDIMAWLQDQYTGPNSRMAFVGMGGFGKSQLAIQFAYHIRETSPETSVFWVHASSESRFKEAYRSIANILRIPRRDDPGIDILTLVRDWLQSDEVGPWLMILDNADDVNLFYAAPDEASSGSRPQRSQRLLAPFLPKRHNGTMLVTSRSLSAAGKLTGNHKAIRKISAMDKVQAMQLLKNKMEDGFDQSIATDLLHALDYIPLAITQAAAYINYRAPRVSLRRYLDDLRRSDRKKGSLLNSDAGDLRRDETVANSVVTTWQVTFEQIRREKPSAADLLSFMSYFNSQGIPQFVLYEYQDEIKDDELSDDDTSGDEANDQFEDDLNILCSYSLVSATATENIFEMHPLVQFCTKVWLSRLHDASRWKRSFLQAMSRHFPRGEFENWPTCRMLLPHIEWVVEEEPPETDMPDWMELLYCYGWYLQTTGSYDAAEKYISPVLKWKQGVLGNDHSSTLDVMVDLATVYWEQGRLKEAELMELRIIEGRKKIFGEEHPSTLNAMHNLASTYYDQGRWSEAKELQAQVLEIDLRDRGEEDPGTLKSMDALTNTYRYLRDRDKDEEELRLRTLTISLRVHGEEHPATLTRMCSLGGIYLTRGRYKEAEELLLKAWQIGIKVLGEEHPITLRSMQELAAVCRRQGRYKEAEELQSKTLEIHLRVLGEEHPDTLTSMYDLAWIWRGQGRHEEAEKLQLKTVQIRSRVLGEEHHHTLDAMRELASTYRKQGRYKEAEELLAKVLGAYSRVLGEEHPSTWSSMGDLALTYVHQSRLDEAEELELRVLEGRKKVLGEDHPQTLTAMGNLARTCKDQGRLEDALSLMKRCGDLREQVLGLNHSSTTKSRRWVDKWQQERCNMNLE